ncbi:hypothetical protein CK203_050561 [Vitis vinifera]|uniref:Uncharacterized protein n=1 Tax=Vitis vinifera TaxID=29760 RepID=A0A438GFJ9_VITVI|nr:hypothetical protein CK203_050561 [Vitis vinifera]
MKYVWIEESPNTASDCGVAPPKKGDGLRLRRGTTRKVEHFLRHCRIGVEKKARMENQEGKEAGRRSSEARGGGASPEKASRALTRRRVDALFGAGSFTKVGDLLQALLLVWSVSEKYVAGKVRRKSFAGGEWFLTMIRLTRKYWEMGKVIGMKHGHRKVSRS